MTLLHHCLCALVAAAVVRAAPPPRATVLGASADHVHALPLPDFAKGKVMAFEFGKVAPSDKVAVFDFDGTLANPMVCMGHRCPEHVWGTCSP